MWPSYVGDLEVYQRDGYTDTVTFTDADGNPIDVSGSTFTASVKPSNGGVDIGALAWSIDMTDAAAGSVGISLASADLMAVSGPGAERVWFLIWDLTESGLWNRTLFEGRIALRTAA